LVRALLPDEGKQVLFSVQRLWNTGEAVHTNRVDRVLGSVEVLFREAVLAKPLADARG
jgi:hypothetical protein